MYLRRLKALTPDSVNAWSKSSKILSNPRDRAGLIGLLVKHDPLFDTEQLRNGATESEIKKFKSIPTLAMRYMYDAGHPPLEGAFCIMRVPALFPGGVLNKRLLDGVLDTMRQPQTSGGGRRR